MSETTTAPAWLNADAFEIPASAVADLRRTIAELRALVPEMERLTTRAKTALAAINEGDEARKASGDYLPDDVRAALSEYTGEAELEDVLIILSWYAAQVTGEGTITDEYREEVRAKRGI